MAEPRWRVAIVDSGLDARSGIVSAASRRFVDDGHSVATGEATGDSTGHGTAVAEIICGSLPGEVRRPELLIAQSLDELGCSTPATIAAAVRWAVASGAQLIHLSLGVASDRSVLAQAIADAIAARVSVVAAAPARGTATYPAEYAGVIRATGDARCGADEISLLDSCATLFGARAAFTSSIGRTLRGSSIGAAHLTRFIVCNLSLVPAGIQVGENLGRRAAYRGRESHRARGPLIDMSLKNI